jgi:uncharacterized repeat protein (TIGR02543 family)
MKKLNLFTNLILISAVTFAGCKKESVVTYELNVTATNGTVVKNPNLAVYESGSSIQLTATPNSGYTFTSWSGNATGATNPLTISMDANKNIAANFTAIVNTYVLNVTATNGTVIKNPDQSTYPDGTTVQLTATPNSGYTFASWSGDATGTTNTITVTVTSNKNIVANFTSLPGQSLDVKSKGAKGDGVTDDTAALQAAVDQVAGTGGTVFVPDGTYLINAITHLKLKSNMNLSLSAGAVLKAIPNSSDNYAVVQLTGISNVTITGGTVQGERDQHMGTTGQWGHAFSVLGSDHVTITGTTSRDCWGDGFYIGANGTAQCTNIQLTNLTGDNNRRDGLSIIHADNVVVDNCVFKNSHGQAPEAGIDIEPNANNTVNNVTIKNSDILNNGESGITLYKAPGYTNSFITNVTITGNTVDSNGFLPGIFVITPVATIITNNTVTNNNSYGVSLYVSTGSTVTGNTISGNSKYGVVLAAGASNCTVTGNTITNNTAGAILDQGTGNTTSPNP